MSTASPASFDPSAISAFQFTYHSLAPDGVVRLGYALDDIEFEETITLPAPAVHSPATPGLLELLHWVAGVSYYKAAIPQHMVCESGAPPAGAERLLSALYSEGLGEFAVVNGLRQLPHPQFPRGDEVSVTDAAPHPPRSLLVPVGGGKDSAVAIEIARASGLPVTLFSVGDAPPVTATAAVAALPHHIAQRAIDPALLELNERGALNGHVPVTAIISCVALLVAATQGIDVVLMANERSASAANLRYHGLEVNHQFSKSRRAERLLAAAAAEIAGAPRIFSVLRPASELAIARAFAGMTPYHQAFTSCNRVFALDPTRRLQSWCCDCDKCRFVYLILAPFMSPAQLHAIFAADLLADPAQYDGFVRLASTDAAKPFECVGEAGESRAAVSLLAQHPQWREHANVRRLAAELLARQPVGEQEIASYLALSDDHDIPQPLLAAVGEVLGA